MSLTDTVHPRIVPLTTPAEVEQMRLAGAADNHGTGYFTDAVLRGPEIIGGLGVMSLPHVNWWMHSKKAGLRDSLHVVGAAEWLMRRMRQPEMYMPVADESPYLPHMERFGFVKVGTYNLFKKGLV